MSVVGRKNAHFTKEQLQKCLDNNMSLREIGYTLSVGYTKLARKMKEWGLVRERKKRFGLRLG